MNVFSPSCPCIPVRPLRPIFNYSKLVFVQKNPFESQNQCQSKLSITKQKIDFFQLSRNSSAKWYSDNRLFAFAPLKQQNRHAQSRSTNNNEMVRTLDTHMVTIRNQVIIKRRTNIICLFVTWEHWAVEYCIVMMWLALLIFKILMAQWLD